MYSVTLLGAYCWYCRATALSSQHQTAQSPRLNSPCDNFLINGNIFHGEDVANEINCCKKTIRPLSGTGLRVTGDRSQGMFKRHASPNQRRGPIPNPLPPAILDQLINVFWKMFDQAPTMRSCAGLLGGPTYKWVQKALVIARDRLEPEAIRKAEKNAALPPMPPWSAPPTSSVEIPAARRMKRHRSSPEERVLSAINRLLQSGAMGEDLQRAIRRWKIGE